MARSLFVFLFVFSTFSTAYSDGYYGRFWRGEEKKAYPELREHCDDRTTDCFVELINRWLIPATPSYAAKEALVAYAPVLLPRQLKEKYQDEVALILYDSKESYHRLRSDSENIEGSTYGPIHGDIFESGEECSMASSRSLVPREFDDELNLGIGGKKCMNLQEVSYDLLGERNDLIRSYGTFILIERTTESVEVFQERVLGVLNDVHSLKNSRARERGYRTRYLTGAYVLVTEDYMMAYMFSDTTLGQAWVRNRIKEQNLTVSWQVLLKEIEATRTNPLLYERIETGEGANLQFEPGVKPGTVDHYRLHQ